MDVKVSREEADRYLAMGEDELYAALVPSHAIDRLNNRGAVVARGKAIFADVLRTARGTVCQQYRSRKDTVRGGVDLVVLLLGILPALKCPALPIATLIVKLGIDEVCKDWTDEPTAS